MFHEQPMKIDKRLHRNARGADLHRRARCRVKHPCRYDDRSAGLSFNDDDVTCAALLAIEAPNWSPVKRMPSVMNLYVLPDMGRITPRLLWAGSHGCLPDRSAEQSAPL
jgi:hypothetical protein